jgi:hypothetical protein
MTKQGIGAPKSNGSRNYRNRKIQAQHQGFDEDGTVA